MLYRHERPARRLCRDRQGREPGQGGAAAPRLHPKAAIRNQTGPGPEKGPDQKQVKRIGGMKNVFYRGGRKPDLSVPQKRPAQDGGGCPGGQTLDKLDAMSDADFEAQRFQFTDE